MHAGESSDTEDLASPDNTIRTFAEFLRKCTVRDRLDLANKCMHDMQEVILRDSKEETPLQAREHSTCPSTCLRVMDDSSVADDSECNDLESAPLIKRSPTTRSAPSHTLHPSALHAKTSSTSCFNSTLHDPSSSSNLSVRFTEPSDLNKSALLGSIAASSSMNDDQIKRLSADIAAENTDMIHFQQILNRWIRSQTGCRLSAFLLISRECNACFCQVCGEHILKESVNCGEASILYSLYPGGQPDSRTEEPVQSDRPPVCVDINTLSERFREKVLTIAESESESLKKESLDSLCGTLILLQARCGFISGLLLIHRNEGTIEAEMKILMPHVHMIGTLMSLVANVEEQKRLARQSQVFLSIAQNVFSSLLRNDSDVLTQVYNE
ncbi:hypothetical protein AB6A40_001180 [Gnathostoma spinigerum]|uniref:Uncharacterized protein n=1 Tax=Gnathostoma spinigerum TaxID=75299 RepID=A0ABD6EAM4_9BILA